MEVKKDILWRVYLAFLCIVVLGVCILGRAFYIQRVQGVALRSQSDSMRQKIVTLEAERGTIYSEDGQMLSTSIPYFDIYIDFAAEGLRDKGGKRFREHIDSFAIALSNHFRDKTSAAYKKELQLAYSESSRYYALKKGLSFDDYKAFRTFPLVRLGRNRSGVIVETHTKRLNPYGMLARRTIGLARANAQNVGLERTYDSLLKGAPGNRLVRLAAGGMYVPVEGFQVDPENGRDITTTLDINMQDVAENALHKMIVESEAQWGTCVVMEVATGKIKAIANLGRGKDGNYDESLNYALQTTEPGSTIKLATLLSVLESGKSKITDPVQVGSAGHMYVGVRNVTDAERSPKPILSVKECFAHSSNVGMSKLAFNAFAENPDEFRAYLKRFHLLERTGVGLVGEGAPSLPTWKKAEGGLMNMLTMSFGYAIQVSPLQTLMLYNAVANGGKMMKPYLVSTVRNNGVLVQAIQPTVLEERIARPDVIKSAQEAMHEVTIDGTAKRVFKDFPILCGGKTGTAHVAGGAVKYSDRVYQASFAGFFPMDKPRYSCIVVIKTQPHPRMHYGGQLAAPVFKEVAAKLMSMTNASDRSGLDSLRVDTVFHQYLGWNADLRQVLTGMGMRNSTPAADGWASLALRGVATQVVPFAPTPKAVPDLKGLTLRDALYLLENRNIKARISGRGRVVFQDIAAGKAVPAKTTVNLVLAP